MTRLSKALALLLQLALLPRHSIIRSFVKRSAAPLDETLIFEVGLPKVQQ